jgi:hypothetical protein
MRPSGLAIIWYFLFVLIAVFAPGFMGLACGLPVAFFLGWPGTVTDRLPADLTRFARRQVRALTGVARKVVAVPEDSAARGVNAWTCR